MFSVPTSVTNVSLLFPIIYVPSDPKHKTVRIQHNGYESISYMQTIAAYNTYALARLPAIFVVYVAWNGTP